MNSFLFLARVVTCTHYKQKQIAHAHGILEQLPLKVELIIFMPNFARRYGSECMMTRYFGK